MLRTEARGVGAQSNDPQHLQKGTWPPVGKDQFNMESMREADVVIGVLSEVFKGKGLPPPEMTLETSLDRSFGLESLDYAEVVVRLEMELGTDPFANPE